MKKLFSVLFVVLLSFVGLYFLMIINYKNKDVELRNLISSKERNNQNIFDSVWKIINQQAQVSSEYKNAFKDIYPELIAGRYETGGQVMKWIQESNPNFDTGLYKQLMVSMESQRMRFAENQTSLIDCKREHDNLISKIPGKWFVPNSPIGITIVTSTKTDEVFSTGKDDKVDLFK